jgi:ferrochelatase
MKKYAVVLFNLGGPDSLDAVEPFLKNLFSDPDIIQIPLGFLLQKPLAKIIAKRRSVSVREQYAKIGGSSPINTWTERQRQLLEAALNESDNSYKVVTAMRYWTPFTEDALAELAADDFDAIVLLPLYPHFSRTSTGSSFNEWNRRSKLRSKLLNVESYYQNEHYISAFNERISSSFNAHQFPREKTCLLFSAHGLPKRLIAAGDPYQKQIEASVAAIMALRGHDIRHELAYQSKVTPIEWLQPYTWEKIPQLAKEGIENVLIIPISFVSDHVETSFELDIEYREIAEEAGIKKYAVMEGLNDQPQFITALKSIVLDKLNG